MVLPLCFYTIRLVKLNKKCLRDLVIFYFRFSISKEVLSKLATINLLKLYDVTENYQNGLMAQWITRRSTDPKIAGSNPAKVVYFFSFLEFNFFLNFSKLTSLTKRVSCLNILLSLVDYWLVCACFVSDVFLNTELCLYTQPH